MTLTQTASCQKKAVRVKVSGLGQRPNSAKVRKKNKNSIKPK